MSTKTVTASGAAREGEQGKGDQDGGTGGFTAAASTSASHDLVIRGEYTGVLKLRPKTMGKYRAPANQTAYAAAVAGAPGHEVYKLTWNTKLLTGEDVVKVVEQALTAAKKCKINAAATHASQRFDCRGPKWGIESARELDPDAFCYDRRDADKEYNGGGLALVTTRMGGLRVKIAAEVRARMKDGKEITVLLNAELEHDAAAQYGAGAVEDQGFLLDGYFVLELEPNQRNLLLAKALNEIEPGIGVQVRAEKVATKAKYMLAVKAGGPPDLVKAFRKKLLEGAEIEWRGAKVVAKMGSEMDVEKHREQQRTRASGRRELQDEDELGRSWW